MRTQVTLDELIGYLKKSSLPTILVEGNDDIIVFRKLENEIGIGNADVLQCGGRLTLFKMFERRQEYSNLKTAFIADRDMFVFSTIPPQYQAIIFTAGYSIENDLLSRYEFHRLFESSEPNDFQQLINAIIPWFAFEVSEHLAGREHQVDKHPNELVPEGTNQISADWLAARGFTTPNQSIIDDLRQNYLMKLQGHLLMSCLTRFLCRSGRRVKYPPATLIDLALNMGASNQNWTRILIAVRTALNIPSDTLFGGIMQ